jgi:multiple sugar transport system ATP-binding protein
MGQVRVQNITKTFGDVVAVDDVSLTFDEGALTVLVGPSGCGKTTLLRSVAGLEELSAGSIFIAGREVNAIPTWERNTAMVFQSYALYPHMSVFNNLAFPLRARRVARTEIRERVERVAASLDISELLQRKPRALSGGQMQRVALGRAIIRQPEVFLMDEPLSNLDAKLRVHMRAELKRLQKELGITTIYVTHDQAEAMTMADKLVVMRRGRIQQVGEPEKVYLHPHNVFVAGFIGSPPMNFIPVTYRPDRGTVEAEALTYPLPARYREHLNGHGTNEVILGIRPEDLTVHVDPGPEDTRAEVYVTEPMGKETLLTLQLGGTTVKAVAPPQIGLAMGDQVGVTFAPEAVRLFDSASEEALAPTGPGRR